MRHPALLLVSLLCPPVLAQATWSQLYPATLPPIGDVALMAGHDASGSVLLLKVPPSSYAFQAWRLQGGVWSQVPGPVPPYRRASVIVHDSVRQRLVVFGGVSVTETDLQDTWEWDGTAWSNPTPAVKPSARRYPAMAFDPVRGVTVLFGGIEWASNTKRQDTWEWNGTTWQQRFPPAPPPAREQGLMAFDPVNGSLLLHGGVGGTPSLPTLLNDSWSYDGVTWQQRQPSTPPSYRMEGAMVADPRRQRVVLLGDFYGDPRTWEWDGAQWGAQYLSSPAPRFRQQMAYDAAGRRVVVHGGVVGGYGSNWGVNDTWVYATPWPASVAPFGSGCAGSAGTPALTSSPYHLPWLGDTVTNRVWAIAPGEVGAMFVSSFGSTPPVDLAFVGMPGCDLLVPLDILEFGPAVAGVAEWSYAAPLSMALAGLSWRQQAFPFDAAANALGLSASNAVEATFGVR